MNKTDIFITGVGGQGSLSASRILGEAAVKAGLNVIVGEIHGMAQRGGVVESTVRLGEVYGPIIDDGRADVLLGFEPVETVRALTKASDKTLIISNTRPIVPFTVSFKNETYPEVTGLVALMKKVSPQVIALDAAALAQEAGNAQAVNSILLGVLAGSGRLPIPSDILLEAILANVPKKALEVNKKAFQMGVEKAKG